MAAGDWGFPRKVGGEGWWCISDPICFRSLSDRTKCTKVLDVGNGVAASVLGLGSAAFSKKGEAKMPLGGKTDCFPLLAPPNISYSV